MEGLPYAVNYDFIPFAYPNGTSAGTYDDMIQHVFLGDFDAMSFGFLNTEINEDFRGPLTHQVGTGLWFSFSTMVFAQRERVFSNLARFFPLGSSLVPDVSRSILKLTEGDLMKELENKWFGNETTCSNSDPMVSDSSSLGLDSYGHILMTKGIRAMLRVYDGKDLSSHTFRNNKLGDEPLTSCSSCPPSPSNLSYSNGKDITDLGEERMDAREDDSPAIDELDLRDQKC
ncbi:hypothetical protein M0R45_001142 [Rubus argutus]|uniref:Uncharacterized protein n=1 Tax=Rubus argutus TaxID=59490 RepID=A0AAW1VMA4_RUBAR